MRYLIWEGIKVCAHRITAAKLGGFEAPDDVLESGGHHKVLLLQPKLLSFKELREEQGRMSLRWQGVGPRAAVGVTRRAPTTLCPRALNSPHLLDPGTFVLPSNYSRSYQKDLD